MTDVAKMIAELEEAERSATAGPWTFMPWHIEEGPSAVRAPEGWLVASTSNDADARLIALMRTHLPTLLKAVKRQGEALEKIANSPARGVGCNPALLFETARAALKETTDV